MDKFIKTVEVFDESTYKENIIDVFEESLNKERIENMYTPQFTQVNLNKESKYKKFVQVLSYKFVEVMKRYKSEMSSMLSGSLREFSLKSSE